VVESHGLHASGNRPDTGARVVEPSRSGRIEAKRIRRRSETSGYQDLAALQQYSGMGSRGTLMRGPEAHVPSDGSNSSVVAMGSPPPPSGATPTDQHLSVPQTGRSVAKTGAAHRSCSAPRAGRGIVQLDRSEEGIVSQASRD
jgi:hypothetical protein